MKKRNGHLALLILKLYTELSRDLATCESIYSVSYLFIKLCTGKILCTGLCLHGNEILVGVYVRTDNRYVMPS
jgi:hypothetical protein